MIRARVYRMYPTPAQAERLSQWVGAVRFVYNLALEQRRTFWRPGRRFDYVTQGREVTALRAEADWLADVPRTPAVAAKPSPPSSERESSRDETLPNPTTETGEI